MGWVGPLRRPPEGVEGFKPWFSGISVWGFQWNVCACSRKSISATFLFRSTQYCHSVLARGALLPTSLWAMLPAWRRHIASHICS